MIGKNIDTKKYMNHFEKNNKKLKFIIFEHINGKKHLDILFGYRMCLSLFTTNYEEIEELINGYEKEYLGVGNPRACQNKFNRKLNEIIELNGRYAGQYKIPKIKGKVYKKINKHSFVLSTQKPRKLEGLQFLVWSFPSNRNGRQWIVKRI